ncbi:MAG: hypothetical protein HY438_00705 [DPANN group archaeon]|nr:hypothetical protein [DPANN group archaeon]
MADQPNIIDTARLEREYLRTFGTSLLTLLEYTSKRQGMPQRMREDFLQHARERGYGTFIDENTAMDISALERKLAGAKQAIQKVLNNLVSADPWGTLRGKYYGLKVSQCEISDSKEYAEAVEKAKQSASKSDMFSFPVLVIRDIGNGKTLCYYGRIDVNPCELFEKMPRPDAQDAAQKEMNAMRRRLGVDTQ